MIDEKARNRIREESRMKSLISGLGQTIGDALSQKKVLEKDGEGFNLNVKFKDDGNPELTSSVSKVNETLVSIFNSIKNFRFDLPRIFKVEGNVNVDSIADVPPIHIQNFKDLRPYFESLEKSLKYLSTAITLVASKSPPEPKIVPSINFDTKPLLNALQELKDVSSKPVDNKGVINMLRTISEGIGALVERPTFVPPAVTHTSINALQGSVLTTAATLTATASALPTTPMDDRRSVLIFNNSANTIYLGGSSVTVSNGLPIATNTFSPIFDLGKNSILYGIASTSSDVRILEVSDEASGR